MYINNFYEGIVSSPQFLVVELHPEIYTKYLNSKHVPTMLNIDLDTTI